MLIQVNTAHCRWPRGRAWWGSTQRWSWQRKYSHSPEQSSRIVVFKYLEINFFPIQNSACTRFANCLVRMIVCCERRRWPLIFSLPVEKYKWYWTGLSLLLFVGVGWSGRGGGGLCVCYSKLRRQVKLFCSFKTISNLFKNALFPTRWQFSLKW